MNINLNNYESFFLLYVDNELSAAERKSVEEFLGNYPYLQQEMDLLRETVLPLEENSFTFKSSLLKPVMPEEMLQENLLLHLDNELYGEQKRNLEDLLLKDNKLQEEWALLKRTKLDAAQRVDFPDKTILYRHESGRLVIGRFVSWAVAAALIGAGIFAGMNLMNEDRGTAPGIATKTGLTNGSGIQSSTGASDIKTGIASVKVEEKQEVAVRATQPGDHHKAGAKQADRNNNDHSTRLKQYENIAATGGQNLRVEKPAVSNERDRMIPKTSSGNQELARIQQPENNEDLKGLTIAGVKNKSPMLMDTNIQPVENLFARNASFETDENSDDHIFMMDEDKVSRTKAAGFLKKIKRTVERTTKIKPGNSLRIAGFEFAVK